jgi:putative holliday junction resolvase
MRALGVDVGERRIGLAVSDPTRTLARPLRTVARRGAVADVAAMLAREVQALAADPDGLAVVVVGLPRRLDGTEHEQTRRVRALVAALAPLIAQPIVLQDERLTSREAESRLALGERHWRARKAKLDAAAAAVILQEYLDADSGGQRRSEHE